MLYSLEPLGRKPLSCRVYNYMNLTAFAHKFMSKKKYALKSKLRAYNEFSNTQEFC